MAYQKREKGKKEPIDRKIIMKYVPGGTADAAKYNDRAKDLTVRVTKTQYESFGYHQHIQAVRGSTFRADRGNYYIVGSGRGGILATPIHGIFHSKVQ